MSSIGFLGFKIEHRANDHLEFAALRTTVLIAEDIPISQDVLCQENRGGHIPSRSLPEQVPTHRDPAFGFGAVHDFPEAFDTPPPFNRANADAEEGRRLLVSALHCIQLFQFGQIDIGFWARHLVFMLLK
jgi:hypothetical protein